MKRVLCKLVVLALLVIPVWQTVPSADARPWRGGRGYWGRSYYRPYRGWYGRSYYYGRPYYGAYRYSPYYYGGYYPYGAYYGTPRFGYWNYGNGGILNLGPVQVPIY